MGKKYLLWFYPKSNSKFAITVRNTNPVINLRWLFIVVKYSSKLRFDKHNGINTYVIIPLSTQTASLSAGIIVW